VLYRLVLFDTSYARSLFVPRLPWLALCGRWNFLRDTSVVHRIHTQSSLFVCLFIFCGVKSTLVYLIKWKSYSNTRKENNGRFTPEPITFLFLVTTLNTTLPVTLSYTTSSVNHPIPLFAAKLFSYLKFSVSKPSYLPPTVSWMYVDSLNLRRKVPNCPLLTPAISLSVVLSVFGYKVKRNLNILLPVFICKLLVCCCWFELLTSGTRKLHQRTKGRRRSCSCMFIRVQRLLS